MKLPTKDEWAFLLGAAQVIVHGTAVFVVYGVVQHRLGADLFGIWALGFSAISFISVAQLGVSSALLRQIPVLRVSQGRGEANGLTVKHLYWTSLTLVAIGGAVVVALVTAPFYYVLIATLEPAEILELNRIYGILIAYGFVTVMGQIPYNTLIALDRPAAAYGIFILASGLLIVVSWLWIDTYGLLAVSIGFLIYRLAGFVICSALVSWTLSSERQRIPWFSRDAFDRIFPTSLGLFVSDIPAMFCDPAAKLLLNHFGDLAFVGYYEMARRLASQLREIVIRPTRMMIPRLASAIEEGDVDRERMLFGRIQRSLNTLAILFFTSLVCGTPIISAVWLGYSEPLFAINLVFATASSAVGLLAVPSYFGFIALGRPVVILIAHSITLAVLVMLGAAAGSAGGVIPCLAFLSVGYAVGAFYQINRMFSSRITGSVLFNVGWAWTVVAMNLPMIGGFLIDQIVLSEEVIAVRLIVFGSFAAISVWQALKSIRTV